MPYDIGLETPEETEEIVCPECGWESDGCSHEIQDNPPPYECPVCGHTLYDPEDYFDDDLKAEYDPALEWGGHEDKR